MTLAHAASNFVSSQESASTNPSSYGTPTDAVVPPTIVASPRLVPLQQPSLASPLTPWTLGSTNGVFALQLVGLQQQEQQQETHGGGVKIAPNGEASESIATSMSSESLPPPLQTSPTDARAAVISNQQSLYQDRLLRQPSSCVESILAAACQVMAFDIAEVWLRTGPKTHQLTNSHLRPTALADDSERRSELVDVYYGEKSSERTHRLSPALCKRAKEAQDVVWITAHTPTGADALRCSISNVRTAVALPVCHEASNTNLTILFFSIRR